MCDCPSARDDQITAAPLGILSTRYSYSRLSTFLDQISTHTHAGTHTLSLNPSPIKHVALPAPEGRDTFNERGRDHFFRNIFR